MSMRKPLLLLVPAALLCSAVLLLALAVPVLAQKEDRVARPVDTIAVHARSMVNEGRQTFRYETFGDQSFWTGTLQIHRPLATVSPRTALGVGLKVDSEALPQEVLHAIRRGRVNLDDPAVTATLLKLGAVVGVQGSFAPAGRLTSAGITCALCHSTVDDSVAPGIGKRLDGWANRDLNVGAIVTLAPDLSAGGRPAGCGRAAPCAPSCRAGDRAASTPSCSWTARPSVRTARRGPRSFRRPSASPASTSTPTPAGAPCPTGTPSWPTWRCTARGPSTMRG